MSSGSCTHAATLPPCKFLPPLTIHSGDDLISLVTLVLKNSTITTEYTDFGLASNFWRRVNETPGRWSPDWARLALAAADFTGTCLQDYAHNVVRWVLGGGGNVWLRCELQDSASGHHCQENSNATRFCISLPNLHTV